MEIKTITKYRIYREAELIPRSSRTKGPLSLDVDGSPRCNFIPIGRATTGGTGLFALTRYCCSYIHYHSGNDAPFCFYFGYPHSIFLLIYEDYFVHNYVVI